MPHAKADYSFSISFMNENLPDITGMRVPTANKQIAHLVGGQVLALIRDQKNPGYLHVIGVEGDTAITRFFLNGASQGDVIKIPVQTVRQAIDETTQLLEKFREPASQVPNPNTPTPNP